MVHTGLEVVTEEQLASRRQACEDCATIQASDKTRSGFRFHRSTHRRRQRRKKISAQNTRLQGISSCALNQCSSYKCFCENDWSSSSVWDNSVLYNSSSKVNRCVNPGKISSFDSDSESLSSESSIVYSIRADEDDYHVVPPPRHIIPPCSECIYSEWTWVSLDYRFSSDIPEGETIPDETELAEGVTVDLSSYAFEISAVNLSEQDGSLQQDQMLQIQILSTTSFPVSSSDDSIELPITAFVPPTALQYYMNSAPPGRPWISQTDTVPAPDSAMLTVLSYNVLSERYCTPQQYAYCPHWALSWDYRRKLILSEIRQHDPDVISLQEVETDVFYNYFAPALEALGYEGIFAAKSRERTMKASQRRFVDGCAIFYRTSKFQLVYHERIEFSQMALETGHHSNDMMNRVQTRDNVAIAAILQTATHPQTDVAPRQLLVANAHIHWDPEFCDVKLVQTMMLMNRLEKISSKYLTSNMIDRLNAAGELKFQPCTNEAVHPTVEFKYLSSSDSEVLSDFEEANSLSESDIISCSSDTTSSSGFSESLTDNLTMDEIVPSEQDLSGVTTECEALDSNNLSKLPLILCGDFNSLPDSGVVEYLRTSRVASDHPDFKGFAYGKALGHAIRENQLNFFSHKFCLQPAFGEDTVSFTNYTYDFCGNIDYVFCSEDVVKPLGALGSLDETWLNQHEVVGLPHPHIPSDHLSLVVQLEVTWKSSV